MRRTPNNLLRSLLAEADWTGDALARAVNSIGAEMGVPLRYRRATISHWLSGMRPRPLVAELAAEAFSRRIGRVVTVSATGLTDPVPDAATDVTWQWRAGDPVADLADLAERGTGRRDVRTRVYSLADLSVPTWAELTAALRERRSDTRLASRIGRPEVDSAALMLQMFSTADSTFGGGHARHALSGYLGTTITSWLRADASPAIGRELLIVAAQLAYLCGFMYFDDQLHGTAQHYYRTSLWLSAQAGDTTGHALALRGLSVQAQLLGHRRQAVDLAEAAVRTGSDSVSSHTRAFLLGQFAVATAAAGDRRASNAYLAEADKLFERADTAWKSVGAFHRAALCHQHAAVAAYSGDLRRAASALESSISRRPEHERRSRAITLARLAELQFADGHLEKACDAWHRFLDSYPGLQSRRADTAFAVLRARARQHERNLSARRLLVRATGVASVHRTAV